MFYKLELIWGKKFRLEIKDSNWISEIRMIFYEFN